MREPYLSPELTRVASIEDLTLAGHPGLLLDICISVGPQGKLLRLASIKAVGPPECSPLARQQLHRALVARGRTCPTSTGWTRSRSPVGGCTGSTPSPCRAGLPPVLARYSARSFSGACSVYRVYRVLGWPGLLRVARRSRRRGPSRSLPLPVALTLTYPGVPQADESSWQRLVLDHLGVPDQVKIQVRDEHDMLGPIVTPLLLRYGSVWPPNLAPTWRLMDNARGGSLIIGECGDEVFGPKGSHRSRHGGLARPGRPPALPHGRRGPGARARAPSPHAPVTQPVPNAAGCGRR